MKYHKYWVIIFLFVLKSDLIFSQCQNFNQFESSFILQNNSGAFLAPKAHPIYLNTAALISSGQMSGNGSDIRIGSSCCNSFPFWIDTGTFNTTSTLIWVRTPGIPTNSSLTIQVGYGAQNMLAASNFSSTFPNSYILMSGVDTLDGIKNYDWFEIKSVATVFLRQGIPLEINASYVNIAGTINGNQKGYLGAKNIVCATGGGPGGGFPNSPCLASGAGSYGGNAGCTQGSGAICAIAGAVAYGTSTGNDIDMGSGGGTGTMGASFNSGGNGGGSLRIKTIFLRVSGNVSMNGQDGQSNSSVGTAGGGGAGGGILLISAKLYFTSAILSSQAGKAGNQYAASGGGGRIKIFYQNSKSGSFTANVNSTNQHSMGGTILVPGAVGLAGSVFLDSSNQNIPLPVWISSQPNNCGIAYYTKSSGALNDTATWGRNLDGSGNSPSNFSGDNSFYFVHNQNAPSLTGNWTIGGNLPVLVLGTGVGSNTLQIPSGMSLQVDSVYLKSGYTLIATGNIITGKLGSDNNTTCFFNDTISQQYIPASKYYNLYLWGANKTLQGNVQVTNQFQLNTNLMQQGYSFTIGSSINQTGSLVRISGYMNGKLYRWIPALNIAGGQGLFPVGVPGYYRPLQFEYTTASAGGLLGVEFISNSPGNTGLPFADNSLSPNQSINKLMYEGFWRIMATNGLTGGIHNVNASAAGIGGIITPGLIRMARRINDGSPWINQGISVNTVSTQTDPAAKKTGLSNIACDLTLGGDMSSNPLPVNFIDVGVTNFFSGYTLKWMVAQEHNIALYEIEAFENNKWHLLGTVQAKGNLAKPETYVYSGDKLGFDFTCFRIKAKDIDGYTTLSKTACLPFTDLFSESQLSVYPNPFEDHLTVQIPYVPQQKAINWKFRNVQGMVLLEGHSTIEENKINLKNLETFPTGFYFLEINGDLTSHRIIVLKN